MTRPTVAIGVVGCGDVAYRHYFPALEMVATEAAVVACWDVQAERAERAASHWSERGQSTRPYADYQGFLHHPGLDAVINLTPSRHHLAVSRQALEGGKHVYSEKPLAPSPAEGRGLIELAQSHGLLLMSAPAVMATARFIWLRELLSDRVLGEPTVVTAQLGNLGPAAWEEYSGDPVAFYTADVGPVLDQGIYLLHAITGLLGPATAVQAMTARRIPRRRIVAGVRAGQEFEIEGDDVVSIQIQLAGGAVAQVMSTYAMPATRVPHMEIHCSEGSLSIAGLLNANGPVDLYFLGGHGDWTKGWNVEVAPGGPPSPTQDLIGLGAVHFVQCLRGQTLSRLTPEHAVHVMEIISAAGRSSASGAAVALDEDVWQPDGTAVA